MYKIYNTLNCANNFRESLGEFSFTKKIMTAFNIDSIHISVMLLRKEKQV